ncbi:hypothetical protein [Pleionea mediterranea]|jgi:hypothetical protein|uniref:Uncharacterized protein n=1 Tax=Pleionea mediterranea TaxID=523701 RepID=A0A316FNH2_9GAMM|nr:hypothetical protein [Pleionea mediterranea]PWK49236.1 hypothetical protein C8D97_108146 [Pleionea mediterranea]
MKQVRRYIDRVSLAVFIISTGFMLANLKSFPEVAHYESTSEAIIEMMCILLF